MNTIRRPRRRPRLESVNFRSFFWLLAREGALELLERRPESRAPYSHARRWIAWANLNAIRSAIARRAGQPAPSRRNR